MRYAKARFKQCQREEAYRIYVSECARITTENTARMAGKEAKYMSVKLNDLINPKPVDDRSGDEIANDILSRAGIEVVD